MFQVVLFEGNAHGQPDGQVADEAQDPVVHRSAVSKGQVVRDLVNGQHQRVVDDAAEAIGGHDEPRPRQVLHDEQRQDLCEHHCAGHPLEIRVVAKELLDLRVLLQYDLAPRGVRLLRVHPLEVGARNFLSHLGCLDWLRLWVITGDVLQVGVSWPTLSTGARKETVQTSNWAD